MTVSHSIAKIALKPIFKGGVVFADLSGIARACGVLAKILTRVL